MFEILLPRNRTTDFQYQYLDKNGAAIAIEATDTPRVKIGRGNAIAPSLDLSKTATISGSVITINNVSTGLCTVRFAQADLANLALGPYDAEILLVDDSETAPADAVKHAETGVMHLVSQLGGTITL